MSTRKFDESYKVTGKTRLTEVLWNRVIADVDSRVAEIEDIAPRVDQAVDDLSKVGLERIDTVLGPAVEQIENLVTLGFMVASSTTSLAPAMDGNFTWVIPPGDARDLFHPSPYVIVTRTGGDLAYYAVVQTLDYDRVHGEFLGKVVALSGGIGPYTDWQLAATAGSTIAQLDMLERALAAQLIAENAVLSVGSAISSAAAASASAAAAALSAGAANTALTQVLAAVEQAISSAFPSTFDGDGASFNLATATLADTTDLAGAGITYPTVSGIGKVLQAAATAVPVVPKGNVPLATGRTFRLTSLSRVTVDETSSTEVGCRAYLGISCYNSAGAYLGTVAATQPLINVASGWVTLTGDLTTTAILATFATTVAVKPVLKLCFNNDVNPNNATMQARSLRMEDVTTLVAAEAAAASAIAAAASIDGPALIARLNRLEGGREPVQVVSVAANVLTLDLSDGKTFFRASLTANITSMVLTNVPPSPESKSWVLEIVGTGSAFTVAWPGGVRHNGGTVPTINTANGKRNRFVLQLDDGGTSVIVSKSGEF